MPAGRRRPGAASAKGPGSGPADRDWDRGDHRDGDLRPDRRGGGNGRGTCDHAVVRLRRDRVLPGGVVLRGVRVDRADRRIGLHVLLRQPRRARRLDHRLGPDARAGPRRGDRRVRLVAVLPGRPDLGAVARAPAGVDLRRPPQPRRRGDRAAADRPSVLRDPRVEQRQRGDRRDQAGDRPARDRRRPLVHPHRQLPPVHPADRLEAGARRQLGQHAASGHRGRTRCVRRRRHLQRRRARVLRVHRLRHRRDRRRGDEEPAARPADRASSRRSRSARSSTSPCRSS